jgi:hypothetical protein
LCAARRIIRRVPAAISFGAFDFGQTGGLHSAACDESATFSRLTFDHRLLRARGVNFCSHELSLYFCFGHRSSRSTERPQALRRTIPSEMALSSWLSVARRQGTPHD